MLAKEKIMIKHKELVRKGMLEEAYYILLLLRKGKLALGLTDCSYFIEKVCEEAGCSISYSRNYDIEYIRLN